MFAECKYYIEQAEALGLKPLTGYRTDYRNNDRVIAKATEFSQLIWNRIKGTIRNNREKVRESYVRAV